MTALITIRANRNRLLSLPAIVLFMQLACAQQRAPKTTAAQINKQDTILPQPGYDMLNYIATNIKIPGTANLAEWTSRCVVKFDINTTGRPGNITILHHVSPAFDKEIIRLIKAMPSWQPGKVNGQPATLRYTFPLYRFTWSRNSNRRTY